jgi:hypothetical protein
MKKKTLCCLAVLTILFGVTMPNFAFAEEEHPKISSEKSEF